MDYRTIFTKFKNDLSELTQIQNIKRREEMNNHLDRVFTARIIDEMKHMSDAELVTNYIDMHNDWKTYSHNYQDYLENYLYVHALALLENRIANRVIKKHGYRYDSANERYVKDQRVSH